MEKSKNPFRELAEALLALPEPEKIERLSLSPEFAYVIYFKQHLPMEAKHALQEQWGYIFGDKAPKLVILDGGDVELKRL